MSFWLAASVFSGGVIAGAILAGLWARWCRKPPPALPPYPYVVVRLARDLYEAVSEQYPISAGTPTQFDEWVEEACLKRLGIEAYVPRRRRR